VEKDHIIPETLPFMVLEEIRVRIQQPEPQILFREKQVEPKHLL
jgi:hypothetical protein